MTSFVLQSWGGKTSVRYEKAVCLQSVPRSLPFSQKERKPAGESQYPAPPWVSLHSPHLCINSSQAAVEQALSTKQSSSPLIQAIHIFCPEIK